MTIGYSNGKPSRTGRGFTTDGRSDREIVAMRNAERAEDASLSDVELRSLYERLCADPSRTFPPFAERGQGKSDEDAFEMCVDASDFKSAVRALQGVSGKAQMKIQQWRGRGGRK